MIVEGVGEEGAARSLSGVGGGGGREGGGVVGGDEDVWVVGDEDVGVVGDEDVRGLGGEVVRGDGGEEVGGRANMLGTQQEHQCYEACRTYQGLKAGEECSHWLIFSFYVKR